MLHWTVRLSVGGVETMDREGLRRFEGWSRRVLCVDFEVPSIFSLHLRLRLPALRRRQAGRFHPLLAEHWMAQEDPQTRKFLLCHLGEPGWLVILPGLRPYRGLALPDPAEAPRGWRLN